MRKLFKLTPNPSLHLKRGEMKSNKNVKLFCEFVPLFAKDGVGEFS